MSTFLLSLDRFSIREKADMETFVTVGTVSNIYQPKILSYYNYKTYKHLKMHYVNVLHCL